MDSLNFIRISTTICTFVGAPHNLNNSLLLHRTNFAYRSLVSHAPQRAGHYLVDTAHHRITNEPSHDVLPHAQHAHSILCVCSQCQGLDISDAIGLFEVLDSDSTGAIEHWHAIESDRFVTRFFYIHT